jgi:serine/threonine-protein kinase SRPK3
VSKVYNILTNKSLFNPITKPDYSEEDAMLYQMVCFCGEFFKELLLRQCTRASQYFDSDREFHGSCARVSQLNLIPMIDKLKFAKNGYHRKVLEHCILDGRPTMLPEDITGAATLMKMCLRIDARDRASAYQILNDRWLLSIPEFAYMNEQPGSEIL